MPNTVKLISCRLNESDFDALQNHAASLELNQSDYLRYLIRIPVDQEGLATGDRLILLDTRTFGRIYSELIRWGRHYNQAVRALNTIALHVRHGRWDDDIILEQLKKANEQLEKTETGRADVVDQLERLETMTLIGG